MNKTLIFPVIILVLLLNISMAYAANRTALVIGNSKYKSSPLDNPVNDATDIAKVLKRLGFDVILKKNATQKGMEDAMRKFGKKLANSQIGLFYYAGHGMQLQGTNYLIPVNNNIQEGSEVKYKAVNAGFVLAKMETAGNPLNIVILDACRDNPFKRSFSRSSAAQGLAKMDAPDGTIIAYATKAGSVAADGQGRNGTYTGALLNHIANSGLDVRDMFNNVGLEVKRKTSGKQIPWTSNDPFPDYYLAGGEPSAVYPSGNVSRPVQTTSDIWTEPVTGMEFVWVPQGCYQMGQTEAEKQYLIKERGEEKYNKYYKNELPRHEVCVDGFWMAKREVTRGQFRKFINATSYKTDADKKGKAYIFNKDTEWKWKEKSGYNWEKTGYTQDDSHPVSCVSWNDAKAYIKWLNKKTDRKYALPSEAQWEYAARAGTNTMRFWGGDDSDACKYANVGDKGSGFTSSFPCSDGYEFTAPAGKFKANPFGLYDMLGNVREWCEDVYDTNAYSKHSSNNPLVTSGGFFRVRRGGSWDSSPRIVRAAFRSRKSADVRGSRVGFRLCFP